MHLLDNNNEINKWIGLSLVAHLLIASLLGWLSAPSQTKREFYTPVYKVNLITPEKPKRKAAKKSIAAQKTAKVKTAEKDRAKKPPKKKLPASTPPAKTMAAKKASPVADPTAAITALRKKQEAAMAVEKIKERLAGEKTDVAATTHKTADKDIETATPDGVKKISLSDMDKEMKKYYDSLWEKIQAAWALPDAGKFEGLTAIVSATIGRDGSLISALIEEGSGNGFYDQSTLRAVGKAAPFEPLPKGYEGGLEVGFRFKL